VPHDQQLPPAGWYTDPYQPGSVRRFDGSVWTSHALCAHVPDRDKVVEADWLRITADELPVHERFPGSDLAIPRGGEQAYDGGGGWQGLYANRVARDVMRAGNRWGPIRSARWLGGLTFV
jgi:hypothetical protein